MPSRRWRWLRKHPTLIVGALMLLLVAAISLAAPWIATHDPQDLDPLARMQPPSAEHYLGTDALGRDVFSRAVWGGRVSLVVGIVVAVLATIAGAVIGLVSGFVRWADGPIMRFMDGLMAIPGILLAIALMAVTRASLTTVIVAITIPEIPRVARLVRSLALTLREQLFVEAAHAVGTRLAHHPVAARAAQHGGAADRAGHLRRRLGGADRGVAVVPGRRHPGRRRRAGAT